MSRGELIEQFQQQWQQSPLLRWGGLAIAILILFFVFSAVEEANQKSVTLFAEQQQRLERLQQLLQQPDWPERATAARQMRVQLESQLWRAPTKGLAQAQLQTWLEREVLRANVTDGRVQIEAASRSPLVSGVWEVGAQIRGRFEEVAILKLIHAVEAGSSLTVVDQLQIGRQGFDLRIKAFVQPTGTVE